jgi:hypothetical protein
MKKNNILKYTSVFTIVIIIISFSLVSQISNVFAHSFTTDDASYFLGLDKKTKVELQLSEKNYPSNITLSMDHTDNAARLVDDIYYADDDIVDDNDFIKRYNKEIGSSNSTTYAIVVADLLDEALRGYADAIAADIDLTNMSNLVLLDNEKFLLSSTSSENNPDHVNYTKFFSNNNPIFNYANYETAKALVVEIKNIFENQLKSSFNTANSESTDIILKLEKDLDKLSNLINNNDSPAEVMELVHLQIHPSLQTGFGLQTKMNMDGQMNMDG